MQLIEKELSWLSFNERVLQEAADVNVPIIERVRFLGIYSSNLDEFFRVRVADLHRRLRLEQLGKVEPKGMSAENLLHLVNEKVQTLADRFNDIHIDVIKGLARRNIFLINNDQLNEKEGGWLRKYFRDEVLHHITPILVNENTKLASVMNDEDAYLMCALKKGTSVQYALLEIPSDKTNRFIQLPRIKGQRRKPIIVLDNAIRYCVDDIFDGFIDFDSTEMFAVKVTRDADYDLERDVELSLLEKMSQGIKQRDTNRPVRLVYDEMMPDYMFDFMCENLGLQPDAETTASGRYRNFKDFINFPNVGPRYLENEKLSALNSHQFDSASNVFEAISKEDILLHYPYYKFRYLTDFVRAASFDPAVKQIQVTVYRVANNSQILKSLIEAVKNGKKVIVIVELSARFDEEANIEWARELTEAGVVVEFGVASLKCHAKIIHVVREEEGEEVAYGYISTGNLNEKTARIYTDFGLFTKRPEITEELDKVFDFIINPYKNFKFKHLQVSPNYSRDPINQLIDDEIEAARNGNRAEIFLKVNNLVDEGLSNKLYEASQAGVKIRLIVRGMCNILAGIPGVSDNIKIISIVDRYLEHARVSLFYAGGKRKMFLTSADWMTRNIDHRIEVGCPILDKNVRKLIKDQLDLQWRDNTKARALDPEQANHYVTRGNRKKIRSQMAIYDYLKQLERSRERQA
ncbi:Polyphosphate kinase [Marinobacterium sp. xm-a-121]|jgi:polyphosphate kinase|uniref:polyphosphate kinase 1 n=1 Tax=unclassified Marinobacterium TaxID=2644139 RepID=UPI001567D5BC|nr:MULTISPECIES: polyphosphate kinase 1 [unclassified Marinobacterium]NRP10787.1 Polyphosphate kinase [Marinobacterium sp. xm-g-48]NRP27441.1 Polyphosphate kinase [Marinobacterium sp. xm-d-420]NRP36709.1 Polyphosphate kinase [Marinobacterium sp. xm-d-579]NRP38660.1 Polyphosphate kinase [Marinobacterium sp. xm-a-121]NRP46608.1 Polyphosphate kinase [Marinobacterium sp. xm-d-543]